jgi:catechol 2,3-dioxygenase-like lactoylglutathione lyase family enzyme
MNISSIGTHIKVSNINTSEKFYSALGFKKVFEYGPDKKIKEDYSGRVFEHGNCKLEIADGHRAVKPEIFQSQMSNSKISLMIQVKSLKKIVELCHKHHIPLAVGVRHYYWGNLELVIKDPDGVILVFITPYSASKAKQLKAKSVFPRKVKE